MSPPNVYPEGVPFPDARPPQDNPDRLMDDTFIVAVPGGMLATDGTYSPSTSGAYVPEPTNPQGLPPGALSPQNVIVDPIPDDEPLIDRVTDDITLRTGPVPAPSVLPTDPSPGVVPLSQPVTPPFYTP